MSDRNPPQKKGRAENGFGWTFPDMGEERYIYIAGAHSRARTLQAYIEFLYPDVIVEAYLVDNMAENDPLIGEIPVRLIGSELHINNPVFIGTRGVNQPKMERELRRAGFSQIIPVTVELDRMLRNSYVKKVYRARGREFVMIEELDAGG